MSTYSFFPQAPLGAESSAAEEREGKYTSELMSGAALILERKERLNTKELFPGCSKIKLGMWNIV